jgi:hypothetical protein
MATYYKYAERNAESQVNWAEVGKGLSDMLTEQARLREEKKAAIDEAYQIDVKKLVNAPQGTWQDGNATVNNFAHDMMAQQLIDYRLLKNGIMSERDYTLRRENYKTGTNTVFELQKILQEKKAATIDLYQKGEIQALNIANMAEVESYTDFANAKIDIDPYNPNINMSIYETKMINGEQVRVLKKTSPVNVLKGQLLQNIPAFKLDENVTKAVDSLGVDSEFIYKAATTMGSGSITKLIGYGAIAGEYEKKDKNGNPLYPQFEAPVKKFNDAIEQTINGYFSNPYHISSVLTENTGNYSAESYTWSKEEAAKDKGKLLLKMDQLTGLPTLDESAPNYKEQEQEARDYVKKIILGKLDAKREIVPISKEQVQFTPEYVTRGATAAKDAEAAAGYWNQLYTGQTAAEKKAAADILLGTPIAQQQGLLGIDMSQNGKITLKYADPVKNRTLDYLDASGNPINLRDFSALGVELHGIVDRDKAVRAGGGGAGFGNVAAEDLMNVKSTRQGPAAAPVIVKVPDSIFTIKSEQSVQNLKSLLPADFVIEENTGFFGASNDVVVTAPTGEKFTYNANLSPAEIPTAKEGLQNFIKANSTAGGVGAKYN